MHLEIDWNLFLYLDNVLLEIPLIKPGHIFGGVYYHSNYCSWGVLYNISTDLFGNCVEAGWLIYSKKNFIFHIFNKV